MTLQGRRQDRRGRQRRSATAARRTSRSPASTPTGRWTRASPATASRRPTSGVPTTEAHGVAIQADGKIVVAGQSSSGSDDFALARYNPNGSLDTSFSGDGKQTTDFGRLATRRTAWRSRATARSSRSASRREPTATTSPSPATTRTARSTRPSPATASRRPTSAAPTRRTAVALQADGKIVAVGIARRHRRLDFALARYNPNGSLDTTFSGDGKQTTDFGGGVDEATAVAIQADGKIVAVGTRRRRGGDFALARYNPNGSLDTSFSGDGKQTTDFGGTGRGERGGAPGGRQDRRRSAARRPPATSPSPATTRTARSTPASPATASRRPTSGGSDEANGVALQADGKIVAVGDGGTTGDDFALARYNPNGTLDTSFSGDGKQTTDFGGLRPRRTGSRSRRTARSSRPAALGALAATTSRSPATTRTARSTRASPATASRRPTSAAARCANGVALQGDGKIVAAGDVTGATATSRSPATTPTARSTPPSPATASRRPTSATQFDGASGVAFQGGRQDRRGGRRHWREPDGRFRASSLPRRLSGHCGRQSRSERIAYRLTLVCKPDPSDPEIPGIIPCAEAARNPDQRSSISR